MNDSNANQNAQQGGFQQQGAPAENPLGTIQLNYWLSVFFAWLPALIFYLTQKGKDQRAFQYHVENLNFSLVRTIALVAQWFVAFVPEPFTALILGGLLWIANIVLWVFHLIAAIKVSDAYRQGNPKPFIFNLDMVKS